MTLVALTSVVATCYLLGVSTRRMDLLVQSLGITGLSKSQVSVMAKDLDGLVRDSASGGEKHGTRSCARRPDPPRTARWPTFIRPAQQFAVLPAPRMAKGRFVRLSSVQVPVHRERRSQ